MNQCEPFGAEGPAGVTDALQKVDCLATDATWQEVSGRGEVFSYNVMHQVYHPAFATEVPYAVVLVKLEEGPKITSNVIDCPPIVMPEMT